MREEISYERAFDKHDDENLLGAYLWVGLASAADPGALYRKMIPADKQLDPA